MVHALPDDSVVISYVFAHAYGPRLWIYVFYYYEYYKLHAVPAVCIHTYASCGYYFNAYKSLRLQLAWAVLSLILTPRTITHISTCKKSKNSSFVCKELTLFYWALHTASHTGICLRFVSVVHTRQYPTWQEVGVGLSRWADLERRAVVQCTKMDILQVIRDQQLCMSQIAGCKAFTMLQQSCWKVAILLWVVQICTFMVLPTHAYVF